MVRIAITAACLAVLLSALSPKDGHAFRCGSGLVTEGDRSGKVLIECGPPTFKEAGGVKTTEKSRTTRGKKTLKSSGTESIHEKSGKVERWTYNCGEHDLIYVLTFEGGILKKEETMGYGKGRSGCQGRR